MELKKISEIWEEHGKNDPLYEILSVKGKSYGRWDPNDFFATGESEINEIFSYLEEKKIDLLAKDKALDFGCGVGRLTQALANQFDEVTGVDISGSMIEKAKEFNKFPEKCKYLINKKDDLSLLESNSFDFIYSSITLQHIPPDISKQYIKEFIRVLKPQGLLIFQLPVREISFFTKSLKALKELNPRNFLLSITPKPILKIYRKIRLRNFTAQPVLMFGEAPYNVKKLLTENGGKTIDTNIYNDWDSGWVSARYIARKE